MRMYEKLGINLNTVEGLEKIFRLQCEDINDGHDGSKEKCKYPNSCNSCKRCKAERLFAEVPTKKVKRWETIKIDGDLKKIIDEWVRNGDECEACGYTDKIKYCIRCFQNYLCEEIEVEDD